MDILKLIKKDHEEAKKLVKRLEKKTEKPSAETLELTKKLAIEVILHANSEEEALYTMCQEHNLKFRDFALEGYVEHALIENTLQNLVETKPGKDGHYKAILSVVKELLEHHAEEEEEKEMFPKLKKAFNSKLRDEMGQIMMQVKEALRPKIAAKFK